MSTALVAATCTIAHLLFPLIGRERYNFPHLTSWPAIRRSCVFSGQIVIGCQKYFSQSGHNFHLLNHWLEWILDWAWLAPRPRLPTPGGRVIGLTITSSRGVLPSLSKKGTQHVADGNTSWHKGGSQDGKVADMDVSWRFRIPFCCG